MMTKQCTKCNEIKELILFIKRSANKSGYGSWCKKCHSVYNKKYSIDNREKYVQWHKNWESNNKEKRLEINRNFRKTDKFKVWKKAYMKIRWKNAKDNLSDYYVKHLLSKRTPLQNKDIPNELVEIKREHLKLIRAIKDA